MRKFMEAAAKAAIDSNPPLGECGKHMCQMMTVRERETDIGVNICCKDTGTKNKMM